MHGVARSGDTTKGETALSNLEPEQEGYLTIIEAVHQMWPLFLEPQMGRLIPIHTVPV